jgi:hypothetical protein
MITLHYSRRQAHADRRIIHAVYGIARGLRIAAVEGSAVMHRNSCASLTYAIIGPVAQLNISKRCGGAERFDQMSALR